jgi:hypothetical protein
MSEPTTRKSRGYGRVIEIVVESALLYSVALIVFLPFLVSKSFDDAYPQAVLAQMTVSFTTPNPDPSSSLLPLGDGSDLDRCESELRTCPSGRDVEGPGEYIISGLRSKHQIRAPCRAVARRLQLFGD